MAPADAEVVCFTLYGADVMFKSNSTFEAQFLAKPADNDQWEIVLNESGVSQGETVPVTLKNTSPTT